MDILLDILSWAFLLAGGAFLLIGGLGLIRLPDFYSRMHAAGIIDTLGADLILMGMIFQAGFSLVTVKLLLIGAFIFITSPTSTHAVANAALVAGLEPKLSTDDTESTPAAVESQDVTGLSALPDVQKQEGASSES
ncbi:MAG TPA: monovalent cation/H(+) antiporter subunit G [Kiloniellaceae bacterium]|nr:monovalent cation/H(+) antiporter subunit G [Kiloniellaceae bacterium]